MKLDFYGLWSCLKSKQPITVIENKDIKIMSYNIRCINQNDRKERGWLFRAPLIKKILQKHNPDIIGFQEATLFQLAYLKSILKDYDWVYRRRDHRFNSETNALFFKRNRFSKVCSDTFFLSEPCHKMGNSFHGACYRICTYACLKDKKIQKEITVFNTHLDHKNAEARFKSIELILNQIQVLGFQQHSHIIMGDMNDVPNSEVITKLFENHKDASAFNQNQSLPTYNAYGDKNRMEKIDYIALELSLKQNDYQLIDELTEGVYPSDHYPIMVSISL